MVSREGETFGIKQSMKHVKKGMMVASNQSIICLQLSSSRQKSTRVEVSLRNTNKINKDVQFCGVLCASSLTSQALYSLLETTYVESFKKHLQLLEVLAAALVMSILYLIDTLNSVQNIQPGKPEKLMVEEYTV